MFLDYCKIWIESGKGGDGCVAFRREKYIPLGGPFGGNGGRGGNVVFKSVKNLSTLSKYQFKHHFFAKNGEPGKGKGKDGHDADCLELLVPVGTQIFEEDGQTLIIDMDKDGQLFKALRGGRGGYGNMYFKSSTNQAPQNAVPGEKGRGKWVILNLKVIADIGLVGKPNAGKSTLISAISNALPKIADYPFTTLKPALGVVEVYGNEFIAVDIPGLIKDASKGKGLGTKFLMHTERCRSLAHLISLEEEDLFFSYQEVRKELLEYSSSLSEKEEIIILTKSDLISEDEVNDKLSILKNKLYEVYNKGIEIIVISALCKKNIDLCKRLMLKIQNNNCQDEEKNKYWDPLSV